MSFTKKLTRTLLGKSAAVACPKCRRLQEPGDRCFAGCGVAPKRLTAGDSTFFAPTPTSLEMVPQDTLNLRPHRLALGCAAYVGGLGWLTSIALDLQNPDLFLLGLVAVSLVPIGIVLIPRLKRKRKGISRRLSGVSQPALPPDTADTVEGIVRPANQTVETHLEGTSCVLCSLVGYARRGIAVRSQRGESFQIRSGEQNIVVRGPFEVIGTPAITAKEIGGPLARKLRLNHVDQDGMYWQEHVLVEGTRVRVYGVGREMHVPELSPYREELALVIESNSLTVVEILSDE